MRASLRAAVVLIGSVVMSCAIGWGLDEAGVSPSYDGDMFTAGLFAGVGLGFILIGFVRDP